MAVCSSICPSLQSIGDGLRPVAGGVSVLIEQLDIPWPAGMGGMEECAGEQSQDGAARTVIERRTDPAVQAYRGPLVE